MSCLCLPCWVQNSILLEIFCDSLLRILTCFWDCQFFECPRQCLKTEWNICDIGFYSLSFNIRFVSLFGSRINFLDLYNETSIWLFMVFCFLALTCIVFLMIMQRNSTSLILSMDHTITEALTLGITSMNMQAMNVTTACMFLSLSLLFIFYNVSHIRLPLTVERGFNAETQLRMNSTISSGTICNLTIHTRYMTYRYWAS